MKRFLSLFLSCIFVIGVVFCTPVTACAEGEEGTGNEMQIESPVTLANGLKLTASTTDDVTTYTITGFEAPEGFDNAIIIPAKYNGIDIVAIDGTDSGNLFSSVKDTLKSVAFEEGSKIQVIPTGLFSGCVELDSVTLGAEITTIQELAFKNCPLLKSIIIPNSVSEIHPEAFTGTTLSYVFFPVKRATEESQEIIINGIDATDLFPSAKLHDGMTTHTAKGDAVWTIKEMPNGCKAGVAVTKECVAGECDVEITKAIPGNSEHDWVENEEQRVEATCTEAGEKTYICQAEGCSATKTETIEALGHTPEENYTYTPPTCTEKGSLKKMCTVAGCGKVAEEIEINTIPHNYRVVNVGTLECHTTEKCTVCGAEDESKKVTAHDETLTEKVIKEATCKEDGIKEFTCSCGYSYQEEFEAENAEHTPSNYYVVASDPTCTAAGSKHKICTVCGTPIENSAEAISALGHSFGEWETTKEASCTEAGSEKRECACGAVETRAISMLAHDFDEEYTIDKEATCTEAGLKSKHCKNCDEKTDAQIIVATNETHDYQLNIDAGIAATCKEDGYTVSECSKCHDKITTVIQKLGCVKPTDVTKIETKAPTCEEAGYEKYNCTRCNQPVTKDYPALGHTPEANYTYTAPTCTKEGSLIKMCIVDGCGKVAEEIKIAKLSHEMDEGTVTKAPTCTEKGVKTFKCKNCDYTETQELNMVGHTESEWLDDEDKKATCTKDGEQVKICTVCKDELAREEKKAFGHTESEWIVDNDSTCSAAGSKHTECKTCHVEIKREAIAIKTHELSEWIVEKEPSCNVSGSQYKECKLCKTKMETQVIPALTHTFSEWVVEKAPTCETTGVKTRECSICKEKETDVIEKIDHANAELKDEKAPTCTESGYTGDLYCPDCKKVIEVGVEVDANGHKESDWIIEKPATFKEKGSKYKECTICKEKLETAVVEVLTLDTPVVKISNDPSGVKVSWSQDEDAAGYTVYRSTLSGKKWSSWKNMGTAKNDKSSWVDKSVKAETTYKYTVRAVNGEYKSAYKESASLKYVPAPTMKVTMTATGILTTWNKINNADSYTVYRSEMKDGKWGSWVNLGKTSSAKNSYSDNKVKSGTTYKYTVRTTIDGVMSGYKATSSIIFLDQPTLKISNGANGITGKWDLVDGATGYTIYRSQYNPSTKKWSSWLNLGTAKETSKSFTDKTAKTGTKYKYTIRAVNGSFKSTYTASNQLTYVAQPTLKISIDGNTIKGSWNKISGATGYTLYRSQLDAKTNKWSSWKTLGTAKATTKSFTDKTVVSGVRYRYTVRALVGSTKSSYVASNELTFLTTPTVKISTVATGVKVSWNKITGANTYTIYRKELNDSGKWTSWVVLTDKATGTSYVDETAKSGVKYSYTARAVNGDSRSVYTASSTLLYLAAPKVTIENDAKGIKVNWTEVDGAGEYVIYKATLNAKTNKWSSWVVIATKDATVSSVVDTKVKEGETYKYTARAVDGSVKSYFVASETLTKAK